MEPEHVVVPASLLVDAYDLIEWNAGAERGGDTLQKLRDIISNKVRVPNLDWSEECAPNKDCAYNHIEAPTPFGRILITWKGWKDDPAFMVDEHPVESFKYHVGHTLDNIKSASELALLCAVKSLLGIVEGA